jgi:hypothetical protein
MKMTSWRGWSLSTYFLGLPIIAGVGCGTDDREARGTQGASEVRRAALAAGTSLVQRAQLVVSDGATNGELSQFGISGDTVVVGGPGNNFGPTAPVGAANVFVRPPGGWAGTLNEQAKLIPSDGQPGDYFARFAINGDVIVGGSYEDNVGTNPNQGSAYVFVRPPGGWSGTLTQSAKLTASDGAPEDRFGLRVAVRGDLIVIGVRGDDAPQLDRGSAYVFVKPAAGWSGNLTQSAKLTASDGLAGDNFGSALVVRDDVIVVGAFWEDRGTTDTREGAAYVFVRPAAGWSGNLTQAAKLIASDGVPRSFLGTVAAMHGDTIVVGAPQSVEGLVGGAGAAYVFERPAAGWSGTLTETAKLTASGGVVGDRFGVSVAFDGDTILVAADSTEIGANVDQGSVYRFDRPAGGWSGTLTAGPVVTAADGASGDQFANSIVLDGNTLGVGAVFDDIGANVNQGSVYLFEADQVPVLTLPGDITAEATSAAGAAVTFTVQANDPEQGPLTATCVPASGATFPLGTTQVDCAVTDAAGQPVTGSFLVTVVDTTGPALAVPAGVAAEAAGPAGAPVAYAATATDLVDGAVTPTCAPPPGAVFPLGATSVTCTAADTRGNTVTATFTATVADTTPPALIVPSDIVAEATGPAGAVVHYATTAGDVVDGAIAPLCTPASGATFPLGTTSVTCVATDAHGNAATAMFTVSVADTVAPSLALPGDITAVATSPAGAVVSYVATASDLVDGPVAAVCTPDSGSTFGVGTASVTCVATDAAGNAAVGGFTVTVAPEPDPDPETIAFASFKVFAQIDLRPRGNDDRFAFEALFALGAGSDGIDPTAEDVVLTLGGATWTIAAGDLDRTRSGAFVFNGVVGTTRLGVAIHPLPGRRFLLLAIGDGAELTGISNPVPVGLTVGDDSGTSAVVALIH